MPNVLQGIANNPDLLKAVRDVIEKHFTLDELSDNDSDEVIGQKARARVTGLKLIEAAFREISSHKAGGDKPKMPYTGA